MLKNDNEEEINTVRIDTMIALIDDAKLEYCLYDERARDDLCLFFACEPLSWKVNDFATTKDYVTTKDLFVARMILQKCTKHTRRQMNYTTTNNTNLDKKFELYPFFQLELVMLAVSQGLVRASYILGEGSFNLHADLPLENTKVTEDDIDRIGEYFGIRFIDKDCVKEIWENGEKGFKSLYGFPDTLTVSIHVEALTKSLGLKHGMKESGVVQGPTNSFYMRYGAYWTMDVWQKCRDLSAEWIKKEGCEPFWTGEILERLDPSPRPCGKDSFERGFNELMRERCNWPLFFISLLKENDVEDLYRWKYATVALSLFFNSMLAVLGSSLTREFTCDVAASLLRFGSFCKVKNSSHVQRVLRSLIMRTFLPSIFGGSNEQVVVKKKSRRISGYEDLDDDKEHYDGLETLRDKLYLNGVLCDNINLTFGDFLYSLCKN